MKTLATLGVLAGIFAAHVHADVCSTVTAQDCYPSYLYGAENATEATCNIHGCCWIPNNPAGPWCVYPQLPAATTSQCAAVSMASRIDCFPEFLPTEAACAARGCCWDAALAEQRKQEGVENVAGVPYCFYKHTDGYTAGSIVSTATGLQTTLTWDPTARSNYGSDAATLNLAVYYETQTRVHFKITDPTNPHFEIPPGLVFDNQPPASAAPITDYNVQIFRNPFGIYITRKSNGQVLFDSRVTSNPGSGGLIFTPQYIELTTSLPPASGPDNGIHIYGLGEHVDYFQLPANHTGSDAYGNLYTIFSRDQGTPVETPGGAQNLYGVHPYYMIHDPVTGNAFGVLLFNSNAMDVLLQPSSLTYRVTGGVFDIYVFTGPTPADVTKQYLDLVGRPHMPPLWSLGFHLCRWGYNTLANTITVNTNMRNAQINQDSQWNDIDYMNKWLDFTTDPVNYPLAQFAQFIDDLHNKYGQHYVQIIDPGISSVQPAGSYPTFDQGLAQNVYILHNGTNTPITGKVWPGFVNFPDWSHPNASSWWQSQFQTYRQQGMAIDGAWIDMNEVSNFCDGYCSDADAVDMTPEGLKKHYEKYVAERNARLMKRAETLQAMEKKGIHPAKLSKQGLYNALGKKIVGGKQGGTSTSSAIESTNTNTKPNVRGRNLRQELVKNAGRKLDTTVALEAGQTFVDPRYPPYLPGRLGGAYDLASKTINPTSLNQIGAQYDVHSLFGFMEGALTRDALENIRNERSLVIGRSTFIGSGARQGHWLGDNTATWSDLYWSIPGVLTFNLFGIPLVGSDTCGFGGPATTPELCTRWSQVSAFVAGFYRNHNTIGKAEQAPYIFGSPYTDYIRYATNERYRLIPYWYTLFGESHANGTAVTRPIFFEFPTDVNVAAIDTQVMVGPALLVSPVLEEGAVTVDAYFPQATWYDWFTGSLFLSNKGSAPVNGLYTLNATLGEIPVHMRGGHVIVTQTPNMTTVLQHPNPYQITIALDKTTGNAKGKLWMDDGVAVNSHEKGLYTYVEYEVSSSSNGPSGAFGSQGSLQGFIRHNGYNFPTTGTLQGLRILGVEGFNANSNKISINGLAPDSVTYEKDTQVLSVSFTSAPATMNTMLTITWSG